VKITITRKCTLCKGTDNQSWEVPERGIYPYPAFPKYWTTIFLGNALVMMACKKHKSKEIAKELSAWIDL